MGFKRRLKQRIKCKWCEKEIIKNNYNQVFCSAECRNTYFGEQYHRAMDNLRKAENNQARAARNA